MQTQDNRKITCIHISAASLIGIYIDRINELLSQNHCVILKGIGSAMNNVMILASIAKERFAELKVKVKTGLARGEMVANGRIKEFSNTKLKISLGMWLPTSPHEDHPLLSFDESIIEGAKGDSSGENTLDLPNNGLTELELVHANGANGNGQFLTMAEVDPNLAEYIVNREDKSEDVKAAPAIAEDTKKNEAGDIKEEEKIKAEEMKAEEIRPEEIKEDVREGSAGDSAGDSKNSTSGENGDPSLWKTKAKEDSDESSNGNSEPKHSKEGNEP
eukprot:TRINITY_DN4248_c0_g1_i18.p1 TRINITY_DN4248_c0_g1~~TRINITY_DN4248_c0_g1_i18.p1  ORF type:complete len:274 (+),score=56.29 TRINITY_DN4248_c0_g1_i18:298-1119(+)